MPVSRTSSRRPALGGLALAALFVVAQASSFTHQLLVQHAVCAQHGELVHVDGQPEAAFATGAGREVRAVPSSPAEHGHEHCGVTLPRREDFLSPTPADGLLVAQRAVQVLDATHAVETLTGIELLRLAPKSSPPA